MKRFWRKIGDAYRAFDGAESKVIEWITLAVYLALLGLILCYHEPWYDEAQAWLIARDGSWKDILTVIPHYEGHPPLWFCILAPFAKAGAPFELTLKLLTVVINGAAIAVLLFRSPFPRILRIALPFTYFAFYQHGVICRPYSLLLLGLLLTASFWKEKDEKPFRTVLSLMLCCASSAYGILLAGGITLAWIVGIAAGKKPGAFFRDLFSGRRLWAFAALLAFALVNITAIFPHEDTFAASYGMNGNPVWLRLLYMFTGSLADATCYSCLKDYNELRYVSFSPVRLAIGCALGAFFLLLILHYAKRCRTFSLFVLPFTLFAVFSGIVYFYLQHVDVLFQFLVFWAWVSVENERDKPETEPKTAFRVFAKNVAVCYSVLFVCVSLYWSFVAARNEVWFPYGYAADVSAYLDEHGLAEYGIAVRWKLDLGDDGNTYMNVNQTVNGVAINAYYDRNIVINMNGGEEKQTFASHRIPTDEETARTLAAWEEAGLPSVTLDKVQLGVLFPQYGDVFRSHYVCVLRVPEYHLWKDDLQYAMHSVYVRKDLAVAKGLAPAE
ncbi:MAG: hypothetical protein KBS45_06395 [Clostridiales bacterium]|nr:hypothetical protein [Candidatus Coliplasma caballi]